MFETPIVFLTGGNGAPGERENENVNAKPEREAPY
jgi:hypothetical protein